MSIDRLRPIFLNGNNTKISNGNSTYTLSFPSTYTPDNEEIALFNLFMYFSWFNLTSQFNNLTVQYIFNGNTRTVNFPPGYYSVKDLNNFLEMFMTIYGDFLVDDGGNNVYFINLVTNPVYYCVTLIVNPIPSTLPAGWTNPNNITLSGNTPQLQFINNNFNLLVGFNANTTYPSAPQTVTYMINSPNTPEINPVYVVNINTNLASNDGLVNLNTNTIYQFNPANLTYGQQIQIQPQTLIFSKVDKGVYSNLIISFTDQDGMPLQINDTAISMCFVTRKIK